MLNEHEPRRAPGAPHVRDDLVRYAWLSISAAVLTIALKGIAFSITDSVGLLSDALESLVNLLTAVVTLIALSVADRPADEEHAYGHTKAEYFSSGFEGALILVAAAGIGVAAAMRLIEPRPLDQIGLGLAISVAASAINLAVARVLQAAARRQRSIALEAEAHHLMTDVWTSAGVLAGVGAVAITGWNWLDPVVAIAVALNIVRIGVRLLERSLLGLLDTSLPEDTLRTIATLFERYEAGGIQFHALRTRQAGRRRFISFHVLVPGDWTVQRGHDLLERIEDDVCAEIADSVVFTHLEPIEDPVSWQDAQLERKREES